MKLIRITPIINFLTIKHAPDNVCGDFITEYDISGEDGINSTLRNVVTVNAKTTGTVAVFQREIKSLRQQLIVVSLVPVGILPMLDRSTICPCLSELRPLH